MSDFGAHRLPQRVRRRQFRVIAAIIQRCQYREYVFVAADRDWVVLGI